VTCGRSAPAFLMDIDARLAVLLDQRLGVMHLAAATSMAPASMAWRLFLMAVFTELFADSVAKLALLRADHVFLGPI